MMFLLYLLVSALCYLLGKALVVYLGLQVATVALAMASLALSLLVAKSLKNKAQSALEGVPLGMFKSWFTEADANSQAKSDAKPPRRGGHVAEPKS